MKIKTIFAALLIIPIFLFFSNCTGEPASENPKKDIIGKWESADKTLTIEFKTDQKLYAQKNAGGFINEVNSETKFIDDFNILATWERNLQIYEIQVYTNHFVLKNNDGKKTKFKRVK